jgi:ZIP family zinc transporter/zinc and cadmium transporter
MTENHWISVILFSTLASVATLLGMVLLLYKEEWSRSNSHNLISYSAGVMLGIGFLHILPEAQDHSAQATLYLLVSFVAFYFLEHHLQFHADHEQTQHQHVDIPNSHNDGCANPHPLGMVAFLGMSLHSLIDGMIIGTGFEIDSQIGLLSALAVISHKLPSGVSMFSILLHCGYPKVVAVYYTTGVALAIPVGAVSSYALLRQVPDGFLGIMMALAAGSFIYIAASDLIPVSHRVRGIKGSISLCGGILTAMGVGWLGHGH